MPSLADASLNKKPGLEQYVAELCHNSATAALTPLLNESKLAFSHKAPEKCGDEATNLGAKMQKYRDQIDFNHQ